MVIIDKWLFFPGMENSDEYQDELVALEEQSIRHIVQHHLECDAIDKAVVNAPNDEQSANCL